MNTFTCTLVCILLFVASVTLSSSKQQRRFQYTPIDDSAGIMFQRVHGLRHLADDRFVFVRSFDYLPLIQELAIMQIQIAKYQQNYTDCGYAKRVNIKKIYSLLNRIKDQMASLQPLDKRYVTYNVNNDNNNDNVEDNALNDNNVYDIIYQDNDGALDVKKANGINGDSGGDIDGNNSKWNVLTENEARTILQRNETSKHNGVDGEMTAFLPPIDTARIVDKYANYIDCIVANHTADNNCKFVSDMMTVLANKMDDAISYVKMFEQLVKQVNRNKLIMSNGVMDDGTLMKEMKKYTMQLYNKRLSWVVKSGSGNDGGNDNYENNNYFDLSQVYKLHMYAANDKHYSAILFITMPLVKNNTIAYNVYNIVTIPFCRGDVCLFMVPNSDRVAVSTTKNYYLPLPSGNNDNYYSECVYFAAYNEYLCLKKNNTMPLATLNSNVCEIEMYMGRYAANNIDALCDIRMGNFDNDTVYATTLQDTRKWLCLFPTNATVAVDCFTSNNNNNNTFIVSRGVGIIEPRSCLLRISSRIIIHSSDASDNKFNNLNNESTIYWPKYKFNYSNYINESLLNSVRVKLPQKIYSNFTRANLLLLTTKFYIRDYSSNGDGIILNRFFTPPQHNYAVLHHAPFNTKNAVDIDNINNKETSGGGTLIFIVLIVCGAIIACFTCICIVFCYIKKYCRQSNNVTVEYYNDTDKQPIVNIQNNDTIDRGNLVYIKVPNQIESYDNVLYKKPTMYPMIIKQIK
ncbi:F protein [Catopsilia pomona nucleopolyhedrovirus]|uniref:F protein n=1 Tax=Catopsilia pomona nucleopolyhedrovirus TaxID=1850906 RepID=A0A172WZJ2_9ABAC|nr:F protein [Catopsilia pomona nucleopolyhedrovirus]ANF29764.1 F protein [Catopsilia pomona nucleopolyhedrovirus]